MKKTINMKKTKKILSLLLFAVLIFTGCNDDFLERYPLDQISMETFWRTEDDLRVYNNNLYHMVHNQTSVPILTGHPSGWAYSIWYLDQFADNVVSLNRRCLLYTEVRAGRHTVTPSPREWGWTGWHFIRAVNIGLENYDRAEVPQSVKNIYAAEARLFRGLFYADKVSKFGDVPWVEKELGIDSEELFAPRTPREDVMEKVLTDLNFAVDHIPEDWGDGNSPGRLNRWAALALKSRVALFEGTWRKYHGGTNPDMWLQEAADAARELIEDGPYSIYTTGDPTSDYNAYHRVARDLTGNPEVIYWDRYEYGVNTNSTMGYWHGYDRSATRSIVEEYLCTDGLPITLSPLYQGDAQIEDVFENRDPRLRQTILHPEDGYFYEYNGYPPGPDSEEAPWMVGMDYGGQKSFTGYHIIKVFNREMRDRHANNNTSETPAILIRLGEVMLNYAEARAELGTITQDDLDMSINQLRDRVAMPHMELHNIPVDPRYVDDGVSPLIAEIRRERRVELFMEGFRYDDLRRWRQGKKLAETDMGIRFDDAAEERYPGVTLQTSLDPDTGVPYIDVFKGTEYENPVFDESKHYLWPLPLNVLTENPNLDQNPNW